MARCPLARQPTNPVLADDVGLEEHEDSDEDIPEWAEALPEGEWKPPDVYGYGDGDGDSDDDGKQKRAATSESDYSDRSDEDEFSEAKRELISMRESGKFKIVARPILKTVRPMRQLKLTEMDWWVRA